MTMAAGMQDCGMLIAADVRSRRIRLLAATVAAGGARSVRLVQADAARALPFAAVFDRVLIDAPCSGLGTVRRDPDIKWRRAPADFERFAAVQLAILREAAAVVRPGGRIVYSTCSSEPEENEEVVARFLAERRDFAAVPLSVAGPAAGMITDAGQFRSSPHRDGLEAFFAAAVEKAGRLH